MCVFWFWPWWLITPIDKETTMTTPTPPSKAKTYVALIGSLLTVAIPVVLEVSNALPAQWQGVIGGVIAILTGLGVYHAPYTRTN